jgi:hypothetical protein
VKYFELFHMVKTGGVCLIVKLVHGEN